MGGSLRACKGIYTFRQSPQIPESPVHCAVLAHGWIPNALLDLVKNSASGSGNSFRQFAGIRLEYRLVVERFPIGVGTGDEHRRDPTNENRCTASNEPQFLQSCSGRGNALAIRSLSSINGMSRRKGRSRPEPRSFSRSKPLLKPKSSSERGD
jgi:hypothetical protein